MHRPNTCGYVPVHGLDVYYEIHGAHRAEAPVVLLHGALGTISSCFSALLPTLAEGRTVIAIEVQGHGRTADADRPLSYQQLADDVAHVLHALGVATADIVGYSMGGGIGLELAVRRSPVVRRLVFFGGASHRPEGLYPQVADEEADPADLDGSSWHEAYLDVAPDPQAWHKLVAKLAALDRSFTGWTDAQLRAVAAPTLLIIGDADIVQPEHAAGMFRMLGGGVPGDLEGMPDTQLAILPGTSHEGMLDRTDWLVSMILPFLKP